MQRLVLFDVDQTLIGARGASTAALDSAFEEIYGIANAFRGVTFAGGLDMPLMRDIARKWRLGPPGQDELPDLPRFKLAYFRHLSEILETWPEVKTCPGVPVLLDALASNPGVQLGLETGNFREAAFIKLRRFGLDIYFDEGGFGGDYMDRTQVVAAAIAECQERSGRSYCPGEIFVVGDTTSDIVAGQENGVETLSVGTGQFSIDELRKFNPSHILKDLSDTAGVLRLLLGT